MKIYAITELNKTNSLIKPREIPNYQVNTDFSVLASYNIAFSGVQNMSGVTTKIEINKTKMLNMFKEILASESMFKTEQELEAYRKKRAFNILKYKLKKQNELNAIAEYIIASNPNGANNADIRRLEGILAELKKLQKIPLYEEPKKSKYNPEDYDLALINLFQKELLNDNFDLRSIYKDYYKGIESIETLEELKKRYPSIKLPKNPLDVIAQRVLSIVPLEIHQKHQRYQTFGDEHYAMQCDIATDMSEFLIKTISNFGIQEKPDIILEIGERVIREFKSKYSKKSSPTNKKYFPNVNNKPVLITELERDLLKVDYEKFVLKVIKDHYLNDVKLNDIVYEEGENLIKVSSYKDSEYRFEKKSEKIKKIVTDVEKIKLIQRDYSKYNQEELKSRLEYYGNSELANNEDLFSLICEFHACKFVAEDRGYLIKLLTVLDKVFDKQMSQDGAVKYLKENNIRPLGTHMLDSIERQKIKEKLSKERLLNQTLKKAQDEFYQIINNLYAKNLGQIVEICSKYYPEKADYSEIIASMISIGLIKEIIDNNDAEIAQNKVLRLEAYRESAEMESSSKVFKEALAYVEKQSIVESQKESFESIKTYVCSLLPKNFALNEYDEEFNQIKDISFKEKVGQYLLNRNLIDGYPESIDLVPYPNMLEKIMQNFGKDKNLATEMLCKYHDYYILSDNEKSLIANILKIFDSKNSEDKILLKEIIENDFIKSDTSIYVKEANVPQKRTIASIAKQEIYEKHLFPNSLLYFEKFEDALPLKARSKNSPGVKKTDRNNEKSLYKSEIKIMGYDDRLVADNNDHNYNHYLPGGMH